MHMSDALLSPSVGTAFWAGSMGAVAYCAKRLRQNMDEKLIPLMGILGAFIFAAQMINFTIPGTGSSGHIGGGMILAILLGPYAGFITIASVLLVQSLFFADGGILALGCNIWNLGVFPAFIAYPYIFKPLVRNRRTPGRITVASVVSVVAALQMGALGVVIETLLSGKTELPFGTFSAMMLPIHLAIGLVEGFITAGLVNYVGNARPEIIESAFNSRPVAYTASIKGLLLTLGLVALITGGVFSWFASTHPDGLEWSLEKVYGKTELPAPERGLIPLLGRIQEKTAILPDYDFRSRSETTEGKTGDRWPAPGTGTSASGIIGSMIVMGMVFLIGFGIRSAKKIRDRKEFKSRV